MNYWTKLSIEYANQRSYLDDLFLVYPTIPDWIREVNQKARDDVTIAFNNKDNVKLIESALNLELFPIKDSYVGYLKKDKTAILRNPQTINRICWRLYEMWLDKIYDKSTEPKETNRQMWPMFSNWIKKKSLWIDPTISISEFENSTENAIFSWTDEEKINFAKKHLNYNRNKWLDFLARFNWKYVIWEAKFLSSDWWSQNSDFEDAILTLESKETKAIKIAILDWTPYIKSNSKMHKYITNPYQDYYIMSSLVLRDFLYQL